MIPLCVSTLCSKRQKSSKKTCFCLHENPALAGFFAFMRWYRSAAKPGSDSGALNACSIHINRLSVDSQVKSGVVLLNVCLRWLSTQVIVCGLPEITG